jgi:hypothetical protein
MDAVQQKTLFVRQDSFSVQQHFDIFKYHVLAV